MADRVGGWSIEALSALLARMERHGLVERTVRGRRTYRLAITDLGRSIARLPAPPAQRHPAVSVQEMPDGPASSWGGFILSPVPVSVDPAPAAPEAPVDPVPPPGPASRRVAATGSSTQKAGNRLTKARVEVLRVLLTGGPIDDPAGHVTRILMGRLGRTDLSGTHMLMAGMVRAGLVHRTLRGRGVVRLEAIPDALTPRDLRLVWSTTARPRPALRARPPHAAVVPPFVSIAQVAAVCGYYDHAHLDRDFLELAGCTPSELLTEDLPSFQDDSACDASSSQP